MPNKTLHDIAVKQILEVKLTKSCLKALEKDGIALSKPAKLYHVGLKNDNLALMAGYIGITTQTDIEIRWKAHRNAIAKGKAEKDAWPDLPVEAFDFQEILIPPKHQTIEFVLKAEKLLRPEKNIGWNRSIGGNWNYSRQSEIAWWNGTAPKIHKLTNKNGTQYFMCLTIYDANGKQVRLNVFAPNNLSEAESAAGLTTIYKKLLAAYQALHTADAPTTDIFNKALTDKFKNELGWKTQATNFTGLYVFANTVTEKLLSAKGLMQNAAANEFGLERAHVSKAANTFFGKSKVHSKTGYVQYVHTLSYSGGRCKLTAVFDIKKNKWTFAPDLPASAQQEILTANA